MADSGIVNKGSKYLLAVNEDKFGVEKWLRFENENSSTPPTPAVHFQDYIAIGAAGDSLSGGGSDTSFYEDDFTGNKYPNDSISSVDPKVNMIGGMDDLRFLLKRFMSEKTIPITPPGAGAAINTYLLSAALKPDVKSLTLYGGVYEDVESSVRGCQIDEVDVSFKKEDGVIPINLTLMGSKFKTGELKPAGVINNLRATPIEGWNIDSVYIDLTVYSSNQWVENSSVWKQIGCDVNELGLNIKNNLDADTGATICSSFGDTYNLSDFTTLNRFRGKLSPSDNAAVQVTLTKKQNTSFWKQLDMGGIGSVEQLDEQPYPLKIVLYNINGAVLVLGFPGVSASVDSPSLTAKADEKVTLDQSRPGSFILNEGDAVLDNGNLFAHFYPDNFYATQGIGFVQLVTGPNSNDDNARARLIVQRHSDDHIVSLLDLEYDSFLDQGGIIKTKLKLYRGTYDLYIRTKADPDTKLKIVDSFVVDGSNSIDAPFCLNSLTPVSSRFGYADCVATTAISEEISPNPIDVLPEVEEEDNDKD